MRYSKLLFCFAILFFYSCRHSSVETTGELRVAASILPLADFARQVGGKNVDVLTVVPPGANPHTFSLTPQRVRSLAEIEVLVINGLGMEYWLEELVDNTIQPVMIINTSRDIPDSALTGLSNTHLAHHKEVGQKTGRGNANPHIWLNPDFAIQQVRNIRDGFIKADTLHREAYERNTNAYIAKLQQLDQTIQSRVDSWKHHTFISYHAAWTYFSDRYGLRQVAVIQKAPGVEPSPQDIATVIEIADKVDSKTIFAAPQMSLKTVNMVATETGMNVLALDPLGNKEIDTYLKLMKHNVSMMSGAFNGEN